MGDRTDIRYSPTPFLSSSDNCEGFSTYHIIQQPVKFLTWYCFQELRKVSCFPYCSIHVIKVDKPTEVFFIIFITAVDVCNKGIDLIDTSSSFSETCLFDWYFLLNGTFKSFMDYCEQWPVALWTDWIFPRFCDCYYPHSLNIREISSMFDFVNFSKILRLAIILVSLNIKGILITSGSPYICFVCHLQSPVSWICHSWTGLVQSIVLHNQYFL